MLGSVAQRIVNFNARCVECGLLIAELEDEHQIDWKIAKVPDNICHREPIHSVPHFWLYLKLTHQRRFAVFTFICHY
jgi:hypothetical protein